jgi:DNA-binding transcriptional ArsR family regulator
MMTDEQLNFLFKALADSTRRRIINYLSRHPGASLVEVCSASAPPNGSALSRPTVTQHIRVLKRAGLLQTSWIGRTKAHFLSISDNHVIAAGWLEPYKKNDCGEIRAAKEW